MPTENTTLFLEIRSWLEIFYFASQIVVMVLIAFGLRQLQLAKSQLETTKDIFKTQCKRSAVEAAVVECRRFAETIIQDKLALDKFCKDNSITYFEVAKFQKTEDGFTVDPSGVDKKEVEKLSEASEIITRIINGLEAYALFFLSGVADENIAFHSNAKGYIEVAEHVFRLFPVINVEQDDAHPIKALYFMWHKKYEAKKLRVELKKIEKKLSTYRATNIKPIGT